MHPDDATLPARRVVKSATRRRRHFPSPKVSVTSAAITKAAPPMISSQ
jgi:hypothetical protein